MSDTKGHIYTNRSESKYIVSKNELNRILDEVESRMKPYYHKKGAEYVINHSQYLDTDNLDFVIQHLRGDDTRYKVRVRSYAPDGEPLPEKYLEVKYKVGDTQKKSRVKIDETALIMIMGGKSLPSSIRQDNLDLPKSEYAQFENLIGKLSKDGLIPVVATKYKRLSYKGPDCRITIDQNIQTTPYAFSKKFNPDDLGDELKDALRKYDAKFTSANDIIVEVKYDVDDEQPKWVSNLLDDANADDSGFSKYMYALSQVIL